MKDFRAVCPVDAACAFRGPLNQTGVSDLIHAHITEEHPDLIASPDERAVTHEAYTRELWIAYETVESAA